MPTSGPLFAFDDQVAGVVVTLEGVTIKTSGAARTAVSIAASDAMRMFDVTLQGSTVDTRGSLEARHLELTTSTLTCASGTLAVRESTFDGSLIDASNCAVTVAQDRFSFDSTAVMSRGGLVTIENNIFVASSEFTDAIAVGTNAQGSTVAFNTFVNTSSVVQSPVAVACDTTDRITSNIFAYNSTHPISDDCAAQASLFDLVGTPSAGNNATADPASFFVDRAAGDFHLAARSPAIGIGDPGIVTSDFVGATRPAPTGSRPDAGAYEAP